MKVRFLNTGEVVDLATQDYLFVMIKLGFLEEVKVKVKPKEPGTARWWPDGTSSKSACIVAFCATCRQSVKAYDANEKVKLEHCGKTEFVPKEVLEQYNRLRNTW